MESSRCISRKNQLVGSQSRGLALKLSTDRQLVSAQWTDTQLAMRDLSIDDSEFPGGDPESHRGFQCAVSRRMSRSRVAMRAPRSEFRSRHSRIHMFEQLRSCCLESNRSCRETRSCRLDVLPSLPTFTLDYSFRQGESHPSLYKVCGESGLEPRLTFQF